MCCVRGDIDARVTGKTFYGRVNWYQPSSGGLIAVEFWSSEGRRVVTKRKTTRFCEPSFFCRLNKFNLAHNVTVNIYAL